MSIKDEIRASVADMIATEREIVAPVEKQLTFEEVKSYPEVNDALSKLLGVLYDQIIQLEHHLQALGGHPAISWKSAAADVYGAATSLFYYGSRQKVTRSLRDDYTALSRICAGYAMLYTTARVTHTESTAKLALEHLQSLTEITLSLGDLIPAAVVKELMDLDPTLDASVLGDARSTVANTQVLA